MPPFIHRLRVRYHECDAQGVVFNANHFTYFDVGMTELWRTLFGSYDAMVRSGTDVQVVDAAASFHAPARFDDELELRLAVEQLGTTSFTTGFQVRRDDALLVSGRMVHVCVDAERHEKRPIPPDMRERLGGFLAGPA